MAISDTDILNFLKELNKLADMDNLPRNLLDKIGYNPNTNSGVDVFVQYENSNLRFVFELCIPYEKSDFEYLSAEEVFKILSKI